MRCASSAIERDGAEGWSRERRRERRGRENGLVWHRGGAFRLASSRSHMLGAAARSYITCLVRRWGASGDGERMGVWSGEKALRDRKGAKLSLFTFFAMCRVSCCDSLEAGFAGDVGASWRRSRPGSGCSARGRGKGTGPGRRLANPAALPFLLPSSPFFPTADLFILH